MKKDMYKVKLYKIDTSDTENMQEVVENLRINGKIKMLDVLKVVPRTGVGEVIVYREAFTGVFKELITKIKIPSLLKWGYDDYILDIKQPLFFIYKSNDYYGKDSYKQLKELTVTPSQIEEYLYKNLKEISDDISLNYINTKLAYRKKLEEMFEDAFNTYDKFIEENELTTKEQKKNNQEKIKKIMRKYGV